MSQTRFLSGVIIEFTLLVRLPPEVKHTRRDVVSAAEPGRSAFSTQMRRLRYIGNTHGMVSNDINLP